jgi:hypothetical protein
MRADPDWLATVVRIKKTANLWEWADQSVFWQNLPETHN